MDKLVTNVTRYCNGNVFHLRYTYRQRNIEPTTGPVFCTGSIYKGNFEYSLKPNFYFGILLTQQEYQLLHSKLMGQIKLKDRPIFPRTNKDTISFLIPSYPEKTLLEHEPTDDTKEIGSIKIEYTKGDITKLSMKLHRL